LKSFSQIDTGIVRINTPIARLAVKELISYDFTKLELKNTQLLVDLLTEKVNILEERDSLRVKQIANLESIIILKNEQSYLESQKFDNIFRELKREKRKSTLYKVGMFTALGVGLYMAIK